MHWKLARVPSLCLFRFIQKPFSLSILIFICLFARLIWRNASKIEIIGHYRFSNFTATDFVALLNPIKHRLNGLTLPTQSNGCKGQK